MAVAMEGGNEPSLAVLMDEGAALATPPADLAQEASLFRAAVEMAEDRSVDPRRRVAARRIALAVGAFLGHLIGLARASRDTTSKGADDTLRTS